MRNDVRMYYRNVDPRVAHLKEGTIRQQMAAYEQLPTSVREALRNAAYDHSPHQLWQAAKIMKWGEAEMLEAIARADAKKRAALIRTGTPIPDRDAA